MTTTATSNYGSTLTHGGAVIGACMVIDFPEIATGKAVTTNHAGGGVAESIPNGLITLGDITLSVILAAGVLAAVNTKIVNKTVASTVVSNGVDTMTFLGYFLSIKAEPADATGPDANKAMINITFANSISTSSLDDLLLEFQGGGYVRHYSAFSVNFRT